MNPMTAEKLRRRFERIADKLDKLPASNDKAEHALEDLATDIRLLAARLSGVTAAPVTDAMLDAGMSTLHGMRWRESLSAGQQAESRLSLYRVWTEMCAAAPEPPNA